MMERVDPNLRHKIKVTEGFVPPAICQKVVGSVDLTLLEEAGINAGDDAEEACRIDKKVRNVMVHDIAPVETQVNETLQRIVDELVEPFYGLQIDFWERPEILVYPPGGFYVPHNDGESVVHDPERYVWEWKRTSDRDISVVWYLNQDFEGGGLFFPPFQMTVQPATGTVVTFPSTHEFAHAAQSVTTGTRFAIATWMAAVGTPRVKPTAPVHVRSRAWREKAS